MVNKTKFKRLYTYNRDFFCQPSAINSYWAGVLAADGCIANDNIRWQYSISLTSIDRDLIEKFKTAIGFDGPIKLYQPTRGQIQYSVNITVDKSTLDDLSQFYSVTPRKSLTLLPPCLSDENMIRSFIRGYFDGDGSLYQYRPRKTSDYFTTAISFNGSAFILLWIKSCIQKYVECIGDPQVVHHANIFKLTFCGKQSLKILSWLYEYSSVDTRLDRKYDKSLEVYCG
jgi:hypothetical protein